MGPAERRWVPGRKYREPSFFLALSSLLCSSTLSARDVLPTGLIAAESCDLEVNPVKLNQNHVPFKFDRLRYFCLSDRKLTKGRGSLATLERQNENFTV